MSSSDIRSTIIDPYNIIGLNYKKNTIYLNMQTS